MPIKGFETGMLAGKRVCASPTGENFLTVIRGNSKTKECPSGYTACGSSSMSAENVICSKEVEQCPITFLAVVKSGDLGKYPTPQYT